MAKCPKCNSNVPLKLSNSVVCPNCRKRLIATFSPLGRSLLLLVVFVESIAGIAIAVIAGSINYPFIQKWLVTGLILLGLIIFTLMLLIFMANKLASFRLK
jgi:hypothetical protein